MHKLIHCSVGNLDEKDCELIIIEATTWEFYTILPTFTDVKDILGTVFKKDNSKIVQDRKLHL